MEKTVDWLSGLQRPRPGLPGSVPGPALRAVFGHYGIASDSLVSCHMPAAMCFCSGTLRRYIIMYVALTDRSGGRLALGGTCGRSWPLGRLFLW